MFGSITSGANGPGGLLFRMVFVAARVLMAFGDVRPLARRGLRPAFDVDLDVEQSSVVTDQPAGLDGPADGRPVDAETSGECRGVLDRPAWLGFPFCHFVRKRR